MTAPRTSRRRVGCMLGLLALWSAGSLLVSEFLYTPWLAVRFSESTGFVFQIVVFLGIAGFGLAFFLLIVRKERVKGVCRFFRVESLDVRGVWLAVGLGLAIQIANAAFLFQWVLAPVRSFLISLGLPGESIELGGASTVSSLSPNEALFLTLFLLAFWWIEVPEELFFRGYLQDRLQGPAGKNGAMLPSTLLWDVSHVYVPINALERFIYGLIYGFVFKVSQNTTPTAIAHSIGNRSLLLAVTIPQIRGATLGASAMAAGLLALVLYLGLTGVITALWKLMKLDRGVGAPAESRPTRWISDRHACPTPGAFHVGVRKANTAPYSRRGLIHPWRVSQGLTPLRLIGRGVRGMATKGMMRRWMKGKTPDQLMEMMREMIPEMLRNMSPEDMSRMMSTMMPAMMDRCASSMSPEEMTATMHEMVPKMMDSCFAKMNVEQRRSMLSMCRTMLDQIEAARA